MKTFLNEWVDISLITILSIWCLWIFGSISNIGVIVSYADSPNPNYTAVDTPLVAGNTLLPLSLISSVAKVNIDEFVTLAASAVDSFEMVAPDDFIDDGRRKFKQFTGWIIVNNPTADTLFVSFDNINFARVVQDDLVMNPAFQDSIWFKATGIFNFSLLYTTIRVNQ